ncbi:DUF421 domain-containing protein [Polyangium aurulentum]|uniref:DUF421 domain-containing protein n=1 Tax=Polyangium aurulentum TaxID=2567896 RepID=UPI0010ADE374|nr:YetF domain-containing protein [Polyangium aurulentum]UQA56699.1 DUF421 domain-containing protein [Polyangium aurulentum]
MPLVLRAAIIYLFLLLLFRLAGKRALSQVTPFNLILLLIISECTQQALIGGDNSLTGALVLITTLVGIEVGLSWLKSRSPRFDRLLEGAPLIIVEDGRLLFDRMKKMRIDAEDILEAAQAQHGLMRLEEVRYAVVMRNGEIAVIPRS